MHLDQYKELELAFYNECNISFIDHTVVPAGGKCFKLHWHDRIEILKVTKGEIHVVLETDKFTVTENSILVFFPRQLHMAVAGENGAEYEGIMFEFESFEVPAIKEYFDLILHGKINLKNVSKKKETIRVFDLLVSFVNRKIDAKNAFETVGFVYSLLARLCEENEERFEEYQRIDKKFIPILDYIDEHLTEQLTTKEVSEKFGYSKSYFCRLFKLQTGLSFLDYCRTLRLERSKKLLNEKGSTANEVSIRCGFRNYSYFSRIFKKKYSVSPAEYIRRMR